MDGFVQAGFSRNAANSYGCNERFSGLFQEVGGADAELQRRLC